MPRRLKGGNPPVLKKFGQHFLHDERVLEAIAAATGAGKDDTVVEIGAGRGALTDRLLPRAGKIVAVEIDRALANLLRQKYAASDHLTVVEADVLKLDFATLAAGPFIVVGNVPYYITTPIIFKTLEPPLPIRSVFLVQREVAERIVASAGDEAYGALTVNLGVAAAAEVIAHVPASAFSPPPKVDSAVVRVVPRETPLIPLDEIARFRVFVQAAFGLRRKQLQRVIRTTNGLSAEKAESVLVEAGLPPAARPETVTPAEFVRLFQRLAAA